MEETRLIGIGGGLETGKSTTAEIICKKYGYTEMAFANDLKEMCKEVFNLTDRQVYTTEGKKEQFDKPMRLEIEQCVAILDWAYKNKEWGDYENHRSEIVRHTGKDFNTSREVLQYVGTEMCREIFHQAYHALVLFAQIEREKLHHVVISDARFINERNMIADRGGVNLMIVDPHAPKETKSTHKSENQFGELCDYDFVINNDKTKGISELKELVEVIFPNIKTRLEKTDVSVRSDSKTHH